MLFCLTCCKKYAFEGRQTNSAPDRTVHTLAGWRACMLAGPGWGLWLRWDLLVSTAAQHPGRGVASGRCRKKWLVSARCDVFKNKIKNIVLPHSVASRAFCWQTWRAGVVADGYLSLSLQRSCFDKSDLETRHGQPQREPREQTGLSGPPRPRHKPSKPKASEEDLLETPATTSDSVHSGINSCPATTRKSESVSTV